MPRARRRPPEGARRAVRGAACDTPGPGARRTRHRPRRFARVRLVRGSVPSRESDDADGRTDPREQDVRTRQQGRGRRQPLHPRRRVPGAGGALGLRQVHRAAHGGRARGGHARARSGSATGSSTTWRRRTGTSPWCSRTTRSTRTCRSTTTWRSGCAAASLPQAEVDRKVRGAADMLGLETYLHAQAAGALRRPAAARGAGARHGARAAGLPVRRAALEPGRQAARADARRDQAPAPARERHHDLRHARPGGGHDAGRPHRGPAPGPAPAGRGPVHALRASGQPVRRRLHRQPAHQLLLRHARRGRHDPAERAA